MCNHRSSREKQRAYLIYFILVSSSSDTFSPRDNENRELTHQIAGEGLLLVDGHLADLAAHVHVAALDRLELQVPSYARMDEQLDEQPVGHQELGDQVHVPVSATAILLALQLQAELVEQLLERGNRGRLAAIVFVPVDVQHL